MYDSYAYFDIGIWKSANRFVNVYWNNLDTYHNNIQYKYLNICVTYLYNQVRNNDIYEIWNMS